MMDCTLVHVLGACGFGMMTLWRGTSRRMLQPP